MYFLSGLAPKFEDRTANLRTEILDSREGLTQAESEFEGGGILMSIGTFPEVSSQRFLAGIVLVGRLGACLRAWAPKF